MLTALDTVHRRDLGRVTEMAQRDLAALWRSDPDPVKARALLMRALPRLVGLYGSAAATLAADYYDESRDVAGVGGRFRAEPAVTANVGKLETLARVAVGPLFGANPDVLSALTLALGGLQRHIANADRETVTTASVQDPRAKGWVRVGKGGCDWCKQYLDGEVHYVKGYDFQAHDHCNCTAVPEFG